MNYIESQWADYEKRVIPKDAGRVQRKESKRAFFAGSESLLRTMMAFLEGGDEPTENDLRRMDLIDEELKQFARDVAEDRQ